MPCDATLEPFDPEPEDPPATFALLVLPRFVGDEDELDDDEDLDDEDLDEDDEDLDLDDDDLDVEDSDSDDDSETGSDTGRGSRGGVDAALGRPRRRRAAGRPAGPPMHVD